MNYEHVAYSTCATHGCGVLTANTFTPLTLVACAVETEVHGNSARLNVRYEYINHTGKDQRVIAAYPLPAWWSFMSCRADYAKDSVIGVHHVTTPLGVTVSDAAALSIPLMPGPRPDGVVATVAAQRLPWVIELGSTVLIGATYMVPLQTLCKVNEFRMSFPMELFPDAPPPPSSRMEFASLFDMNWPFKLPKGLTIDAKCKMFTPIAGAAELRLTGGGAGCAVSAQVEIVGDSGFRLRYVSPLSERVRNGFELFCPLCPTSEPLRLFLEADYGKEVCDDDRFAMTLTFTPEIADRLDTAVNAELIFVVDSHSSYASASMSQALRVALHGTPNTAFVNVVVVTEKGDLCLCPNGSAEISKVDIDSLAAFVAETRPQTPNVGVSHLNRAIRLVTASDGNTPCGSVPRGYIRHVIVLSDEGETSRAAEIISLAARHRGNMCFSAVGLIAAGGPHTSMLHLLAQEGGGVYYDAADAQELQTALVQVLSRVAVPTVTDIELVFREPVVRLGAERLLAIPHGSQQFVHCLVPASLRNLNFFVSGRIGPNLVEYTGQGNLEEIFSIASSEPRNVLSFGLIHLSAAAARVRYLVERRGSCNLSTDEIQEVARYSRTFMLPSPFTQMKQVQPSLRDDGTTYAIPGVAELPTVAAACYVPRHWLYEQLLQRLSRQRLADGLVDCRPQQLRMKVRQLKDITTKGDVPIVLPLLSSTKLGKPPVVKEFIRCILMDVVDSVLATCLCVRRIATMQAPDGSFAPDSRLAVCIGLSPDKMMKDSPVAGNNACETQYEASDVCMDKNRVWATALVVVSVEKQPNGIVTLVYRKALSFVEKNDVSGEFISCARKILANV